MKITFLGAAGEVTGSQHLIETDSLRILLDCGLFQGHRAEARLKNEHFYCDPKTLDGVETFHGPAGLDAFLSRTEILVCLLPRTRDTEGILNLALFRRLKRDGAAGGAFLINAGRGQLQVEADIVTALGEGTLAGCTLDVFAQEPLPPESPLWSHPKVTITPHNAGDISPHVFATHVIAQIERFERGLPLENPVDRARGY